jgi:hypothetical protein
MKHLLRILILPVLAMVTTAFGRVMFADAPPVVNANWLMDFRTICAVGAVVLIGTWRLGRWMKEIDDKLTTGEERFCRIESNMSERNDILNSINTRMESLPCGECNPVVKIKKGERHGNIE